MKQRLEQVFTQSTFKEDPEDPEDDFINIQTYDQLKYRLNYPDEIWSDFHFLRNINRIYKENLSYEDYKKQIEEDRERTLASTPDNEFNSAKQDTLNILNYPEEVWVNFSMVKINKIIKERIPYESSLESEEQKSLVPAEKKEEIVEKPIPQKKIIKTIIPENFEKEYFIPDVKTQLSRYLDEVGTKNALSEEETRDLIKRAHEGDLQSRNMVVEHNLKLVVWVAKKYKYALDHSKGISMDDLIQEGNLGLFSTVKKFDLNKDIKFSTYAYQWIRMYIQRFLDDHSYQIRIPVHIREAIQKYRTVCQKLNASSREIPSVEEISKLSNLSIEKIEFIQEVLSLQQTVSIDEINDSTIDPDKNPLREIQDEEQRPIDDLMSENHLNSTFKLYLKDILDEREYKILSLRFSLDNQGEHTLKEIGEMLGVSKQRIKQIEEKFMERLLSDPKMNKFRKNIL